MRRSVPVAAAFVWALLPAGCEGCGATEEATGGGQAEARGAAQTGGEQAHREPGPPPEVTVAAEPPELGPAGHFVPVVQSRGSDPARLDREVVVEHDRDGEWREVATLQLRYGCDAEPEGCVTLVPGAELRPPPWLGSRGRSQCGCESCPPVADGRYRFVLRSCDGTHRVPGQPFSLSR